MKTNTNTFLGNKVRISLTYYVTGHMLFSRYANFSLFTFCCVVWVTGHVIMFNEIFDKQDSIFQKQTLKFFFITKLVEQNMSFLIKSYTKSCRTVKG